MKHIAKSFLFTLLALLVLLPLVGWLFVHFTIYHPKELEQVPIQKSGGQGLNSLPDAFTVLNYNVQYFAGKDYVFFSDMEDFTGPDIRPSPTSIQLTLDRIAALLLEHDADVVLLQEIDDGAKRTDGKNQTHELLSRLEGRYPYLAEAFYWRAAYVPHPKIAGSVGMKLTTLSKAPITRALRHQLPRISGDPVSRAFNFRRAILETHITGSDGTPVVLLNTHFDAFADSSETMLNQVRKADAVLTALDEAGLPWVIGGDFNLLPPIDPLRFDPHVRNYYSEPSELKLLYDKYHAIPSIESLGKETIEAWFTHFPNHPELKGPDRIVDYLFYSNTLQVVGHPTVLHGEALGFSDHLPILATFRKSAHKD